MAEGCCLVGFFSELFSGDGGDGLADRRSDLGDFLFDVLRGAPYPAREVVDGQALAAFSLWGFRRCRPASQYEKTVRLMEYSGGIAYDLVVLSPVLQGSQTQWISMSHLGG